MEAEPGNSGHPAFHPVWTGVGVPLFHAAWLFALGIVITHFAWLRPAYLLIALAPVAIACGIAALRAQILASADSMVNLIQFFEACPSRHAMIVAFLAVLEMVKLQAVGLAQEKQFGEIVVKKGKAFDVIFDEAGGIKQIDEEYK